MFRGELATLVMRPKLPAERSLTGAPNTTRFNGFDISMRNCSVNRSFNLVSLKMPNDSVLKFGRRVGRYTGAPPKVRGAGAENASLLRNRFTFGSKLELETRIGAPVRLGLRPPLNTKLFGLVP